MSANKTSNFLRSILVLTGSFTFAFLVGEAVHELGHYLAHRFFGNVGIWIHLDPFGGSRIQGVESLPLGQMGVTSAAGPLLNLVVGLLFSLLFWKSKRTILLPALMWGPVAAIQEGVNFSLGLLTPGGDGSWIIAAGVPQPILLSFGLLLLAGGIIGVSFLLPLADIGLEMKFTSRFIRLLAGIGLLMAVRSVYSSTVSSDAAMENFLPLVFSLLLSLLVVLIQPAISKVKGPATERSTMDISWSAAAATLSMAILIFVVQIILP